ncbi:hypothetical protein Pmar_PMAR021385 [Perkinsus marinus ATCC 50983]|uniref:Uncharacterized protein n=1 Tax=Perkinsus marinus (strain ATCC 50983 / TXsc) TaxID=423536 RepID=C5KX54_PERM5|nr:hypothetical protein Pmar_PMAR021385 [Perkinsus marinus ATCC 50983]EER10910.1 hypothetical protein Pmar_PMAR021385 [Perkinsus marinus ATCC 50983]|eukprot:XP_002779115.1 hypothetical protein Pmar_PMAR021385 [Perkinsus marinus ATCC 50983]
MVMLFRSGEELVLNFWSTLPTFGVTVARVRDNLASLNEVIINSLPAPPGWEQNVAGVWRSLPRKLQLIQCMFLLLGLALALSAWCLVRSNRKEKKRNELIKEDQKRRVEESTPENVAPTVFTPTTVATPIRPRSPKDLKMLKTDADGEHVVFYQCEERSPKYVVKELLSSEEEIVLRSKLKYHKHRLTRRRRTKLQAEAAHSHAEELNVLGRAPVTPPRRRAISSF